MISRFAAGWGTSQTPSPFPSSLAFLLYFHPPSALTPPLPEKPKENQGFLSTRPRPADRFNRPQTRRDLCRKCGACDGSVICSWRYGGGVGTRLARVGRKALHPLTGATCGWHYGGTVGGRRVAGCSVPCAGESELNGMTLVFFSIKSVRSS